MLASLIGISNLLTAAFTGGLLLVAVVAASYASRQLKTQNNSAKLARVYLLADRLSDAPFMALLAETMALTRDSVAGKATWDDPTYAEMQCGSLAPR